MFGLRPGWSIEPPPEQYAAGPTQTGKTFQMRGLAPEQVAWLCHLYGTEAPQQKAYSLIGCYAPKLDAVIMPDRKFWPSSSEWNQLQAHEWAHARGWRHNDDGTGAGPNSLPPRSLPAPGPVDDASSAAVRLARAMGGGIAHRPSSSPHTHALIAAALRAIQLHHASRAGG